MRAGYNEIFGGSAKFSAVTASESQTAEVGRSILQNGGNATDAAVAMYFAMAATLPSAAGLGASGACVVHDAKTRGAEAFVFAPVAAPGPIKGAAFTVPTGVRALTLMHIRHGQARWEMDVAPGEKIARFGAPVSRAFARDLKAGASLLTDSEARRLFTKDGAPLNEGDNLVQLDLAGTLGTIRRGGGEFFQGNFARVMSEQVAQAGGNLPVETIRNTVPKAGPPLSESDGGYRVYVAPSPMAGASALAGWKGQAGQGGGVPTDSGGFAGFAAIDEVGNAAACSLSMGQLFGARVVVPGTGLMLGAPTADGTAVSPVVIGNPNNGEAKFAGAGAGSASASFETGMIARLTVNEREVLADVLAAHAGRGGFVEAISCPYGIKSGGSTCQAGSDPAGAGLALLATRR
ncbi:gamma-glutamyltranspeptidase / glutathione hydrolase [Enhydrobacter aerosaccus]|uniref:Gamma-glutamyltranspeptidase / glutathione hydrolase n=2 Tax=Enhydrobacter aerosaccus TaxID=225324 RepID=A0A1T4LPW7_9HYPH|nr:gamma-glutamyltranspeptidase / glutathione hydrolase [Enhydrobacter aerosaccus]